MRWPPTVKYFVPNILVIRLVPNYQFEEREKNPFTTYSITDFLYIEGCARVNECLWKVLEKRKCAKIDK